MNKKQTNHLIEDLTFLRTKAELCPNNLSLEEFRELRRLEESLYKYQDDKLRKK